MRTLLSVFCILFSFEAVALVNSSTLKGQMRQLDKICWEIGRTASFPSMCKSPTKVVYKNVLCWGCPEATRCNPSCRGGKVCINQKCVCPPNQLLYDCNGRCISPTIPCTQ